jgi:hypothetical protein
MEPICPSHREIEIGIAEAVAYAIHPRRRTRPAGMTSSAIPGGGKWGPLTRLPSLRSPGLQLGPDCNLDHTIAPFSEDLICLVDPIKCEAVGQERGQV